MKHISICLGLVGALLLCTEPSRAADQAAQVLALEQSWLATDHVWEVEGRRGSLRVEWSEVRVRFLHVTEDDTSGTPLFSCSVGEDVCTVTEEQRGDVVRTVLFREAKTGTGQLIFERTGGKVRLLGWGESVPQKAIATSRGESGS